MPFDSPRPPRSPRLASGDLVDVAGRPVRLRVAPRARRVSLRLDTARREVIATAPSQRRLADAVAFARTKADWIVERLEGLPGGRPFAPGVFLQVQGRPCRLERAAMRISARLIPESAEEPARLLASGDGAAYARAVERVLKREALEMLSERTARHAEALRQPAPEIAVMDARSRWGSCTPAFAGRAARIRYVWRLVLAPPAIADYVAAHECAHLVEANHGPRFWALVERIYGDPAPARAWLREHGAALHALGRG